MHTAHTAGKISPCTIMKALAIVMGMIIMFNCLKAATHYRTVNMEVDVVHTSAREIEKQLQCMTRNIYWEAASEPFEGKVAVAQVTMNRMNSGKFANSICEVVYQRTTFYNKVICQFSWFCETTHLTRPVYQKLYKESEEVAKMVMLENFRLSGLKDALYYHADYVNPKWNKDKITQIGRHIFYKDRT